VLKLLASASRYTIFIAAIAPVEITAAIMARARSRSISIEDARAACQRLELDMSIDYQVVELTEKVLALAVTLAKQHPLRGYDAVQLAAALAVSRVGVASGLPLLTFVSADVRLNQIAGAEGLPVDDPNEHP
jgi:predicted nucleic acid-binding protein